MRWLRRFVILLVLAAMGGGLWWYRIGRGVEVNVATLQRGTAAEIVYATGSVEPVHWARVTTLVKNRILSLCNCEGRDVEAGFVLARLDDSEARATLSELEARESLAQKEFDRLAPLVQRGISTPQQLDRAAAELAQMRALVRAQRERVDNYVITAPIAGQVLRQDGEIGEIAEPGSILFRVGLPRPLHLVADVNEEDIPRVKRDQKVLLRVDAFPGQRLEGRVREITPLGDPSSKTYRVRIALPDDTPLFIGMSVEANIVTREKNDVPLLPADAIITESGESFVLVVTGDTVARRRVTLGIRGARAVEIADGLEAGDQVVAPAVTTLREGQRVRVATPTGGAR